MCSYDETVELTPEWVESRETQMGRGQNDLIPGTFRLKKNQSNDYMVDRQMQKTQNFTGIVGVNTQDFALQEGMGPICDRSKEIPRSIRQGRGRHAAADAGGARHRAKRRHTSRSESRKLPRGAST